VWEIIPHLNFKFTFNSIGAFCIGGEGLYNDTFIIIRVGEDMEGSSHGLKKLLLS
jgi:hypothetical protein